VRSVDLPSCRLSLIVGLLVPGGELVISVKVPQAYAVTDLSIKVLETQSVAVSFQVLSLAKWYVTSS